MSTLTLFAVTAILEIAGCYAFWAWAKNGASSFWLLPGMVALAAFAWLLTKIDTAYAGRAYAAYGGIYIAASLAWLFAAEGRLPDRWDLSGGAIAVIGALIIIFGPRAV